MNAKVFNYLQQYNLVNKEWPEEVDNKLYDLFAELTEEEQDYIYDFQKKEKAQEEKLKLESQEKEFNVKLLYEFDLAYVGWECDSEGCIIEFEDGSRKMFTKSPFRLSSDKMRELLKHGMSKGKSIEYLEDQLNLYKRLIEQTEQALTYFK